MAILAFCVPLTYRFGRLMTLLAFFLLSSFIVLAPKRSVFQQNDYKLSHSLKTATHIFL